MLTRAAHYVSFISLSACRQTSRAALRGAALTHFYKLSRGRRNLQGGGASRGAIRERGQHERARSRVAFGQKQFSRGVDSNDKDLLWLLAPTKFDK